MKPAPPVMSAIMRSPQSRDPREPFEDAFAPPLAGDPPDDAEVLVEHVALESTLAQVNDVEVALLEQRADARVAADAGL